MDGIKLIVGASLLAGLAIYPPTAKACSLVSCLGRGMEVRRDFTASVKLEVKPLTGVRVEVNPSNSDRPYFAGR